VFLWISIFHKKYKVPTNDNELSQQVVVVFGGVVAA